MKNGMAHELVTAGYQGHTLNSFIDLLRDSNVEVLVDVRLTSVKPVCILPTSGCQAGGKRDDSERKWLHPIWMWLFVCACLNELKNAIGWKSPTAYTPKLEEEPCLLSG